MQFVLFLPFFVFSDKYNFPKCSFLIIDKDFTSDIVDPIMKNWNEYKIQLRDKCSTYDNDDEKNRCEFAVDSIQSFLYSDNFDIHDKMAKISSHTEFLFYIDWYTYEHTINFNYLKTQMAVFMVPISYSLMPENMIKSNLINSMFKIIEKVSKKMIRVSFNYKSHHSLIKLSEQFIPKKNNKIPKFFVPYYLIGDIKEKVSYLTIVIFMIEIKGDLNCHSLLLYNAQIMESSDAIKCKYFIIDVHLLYRFNYSTWKIKVKEFALYIQSLPYYMYQIMYKNDGWYIDEKPEYSHFYSYRWYVLYKFAETFSMLVYDNLNFDVHVDAVNLSVYPRINITLLSNDMMLAHPLPNEENELKVVKLSSSGDWKSVQNKPKLLLTLNKTEYSINSDDLELELEIDDLYTYVSPNKLKNKKNIGFIIAVVEICVSFIVTIVFVVYFLTFKKMNVENSIYE